MGTMMTKTRLIWTTTGRTQIVLEERETPSKYLTKNIFQSLAGDDGLPISRLFISTFVALSLQEEIRTV